jgi:hypothetical protein
VSEVVNQLGLGSTQYELTVEIGPGSTKENEDNRAIFQTLKDCYKILQHRHVPLVKEWYNTLVKVDTKVTICVLIFTIMKEKQLQEQLLKRVIDMRSTIQDLQRKCQQLNIAIDPQVVDFSTNDDEQEENTENEMVAVPIPVSVTTTTSSSTHEIQSLNDDDDNDKTSVSNSFNIVDTKPESNPDGPPIYTPFWDKGNKPVEAPPSLENATREGNVNS